MKYLYLTIFLVSFLVSSAQETIKVMSYNLLNFGNYTSYCNESNNSYLNKTQWLKTIIVNQNPDILAVCELSSNPIYINHILGNSLNTEGETKWQKIDFTNIDHSYIINGLFYDKNKFEYDAANSPEAVSTGIRDINIYRLKYRNLSDTYLHVVVAHLKAGNTSEDKIKRGEMTSKLMNRLNEYFDNQNNFIIVGDFNVYNSTEVGFQNLINPDNPLIAFYDPINQIGNWNNNSAYSKYHTQSTSINGDNCKASGGLDDRFDFILVNSSILHGTKNIKYKENSYKAVGQDGLRFNKDLLSPPNNSLPENVIDALSNMSDHLPIVAEFYMGQISTHLISQNQDFIANINCTLQGALNYEIKTDKPQELNVKIFSITGLTVYNDRVTAEHDKRYSYDLGFLSNGLYILNFESDGIFKSYKIMIQR